ncbi:hypothetical protein [Litoribacillus peritrichatus]|uniref:Uncharacterized protein n=1 Tax=Litoribacillus peritrichatus TaxID=718191 RepID=A0ABP7N5Y3_9GAMM
MKTYEALETLISFGSVGCILIIYVALIFISVTLDRRLKRKFESHPEIIIQETWFFRVVSISLNVAIKNRSKNDRVMIHHYKGFDFRSFATLPEKIFCFLSLYAFIVFIIILLSAYPLEYLGFINLGLL